MSYNQPRGERSESTQYRKTGSRSSSSNQQRQFSGGAPTKGGGGGGGGSSAHTNPSNRSFKKYNNNAPVWQTNVRNPNVDSKDLPAASAGENGAHQQQPTHRISVAPVVGTSSNVKPSDGPTQKITRDVPKARSSNIPPAATPSNVYSASSEPNAPRTPEKDSGDASKSFPLQFGSISPGVMNGMQIPARTSSAPPNLDEQKQAQARHESSRAAPAVPIPSVPKQHLLKKDAGIIEQPNSGEAHQQVSKSKRDVQLSAAPPVTQSQKPSLHSIPGMPMQLPYHQQQVPVQFGGPNPQIQSQTMTGTSLQLPLPMPMSLPVGNPQMFLQPHPLQSQGIMHQGHNLNFPPQMGPQLPPQLGSMGMNMTPQSPHQLALKYSGSRKIVKITHPDTHEELRLEGSPNPRLQHPNVQSQSQPIPSFPPNMLPMNFYPSSYNAPSLFFPSVSSVPLNSTQVPPTSQPSRLYSQVTVKKPVLGSQGDMEPLPPTSSLSVGKADSSKPSSLQGEVSVFLQKETDTSSLSSLQQAKPVLGALSASVASISPVTVERYGSHTSASAPTDFSIDARVVVVAPDSIIDKHKKLDNNDQVGSLSTSPLSLSSQLPKAKAKSSSSGSNVVSEAKESIATGVAVSYEDSKLTSEGDTEEKTSDLFKSLGTKGLNSRQSKPETMGGKKPIEATSSECSKPNDLNLETSLRFLSLDSPKITGKVEENYREVTPSTSSVSEHAQEEQEGYDVKVHVSLAAPTHSSGGLNSESSVSGNNLSVRDKKIATSDASLSVPHSTDSREFSAAKHAEQESLRPENEDIDSGSGEFVRPSSSSAKDKFLSDANVAKSAVPRGKKKMKDLYRKAEASGPSSDLYMAYKGPEEKKESVTPAEGSGNSSNISEKQNDADVPPENAVPCQQPARSEVEPDWEDVAETSPQLENSKNEAGGGDGDELMTKKYSRDFLLKFVMQCNDLPRGFEVALDIAAALMGSGHNVSCDPHPSPGRNNERPAGGPRLDRSGSGLGDEDKWRFPGPGYGPGPGPAMPGRGDILMDLRYMSNVGFRPGQVGNYGVLRNPRAQAPGQYTGVILSGPMHSFGPQGIGLQRNNSDSERWQHGAGFHKGLMPYPHTPMQVMHKAEKKYEVGRVTDEEQARQRQLKGILNKLTPQNFEKLFEQVKQMNIDNVITLSGVISQIFDKALMEPTFCEMYANFCFHLAASLPELSVDNEKITFKRLLLNKCQEEFERGEREEQEANKAEEEGEIKQTAEEIEEKRLRIRRRMLGNIRLIGELYKKRMLTERIMHECINKLLGQYQNPDEENIEALCKLMSTIGEMIDHPKAKEFMDAYFDIMAQLSNNMKLSSRLRFMLKDAIDLRKNKWQQRRKVEGPKKIEEVHRDVAQERHAQASRLSRAPSMGNSSRRTPMDFAPRSPSVLPSPSSQISGGYRGVPLQLRGHGLSQDSRMEERYSSVPLPQRLAGNDSITLGPQGGLARGMAFRGQPLLAPNTESGQNGFSLMPQRPTYGQRDDVVPRYTPESFAAPIYDQSHHPRERDVAYGNPDVRNVDRSLPTSPRARGGQSVAGIPYVSSEQLRDKSMSTIKEFYSARDENEVTLCIKELNTPSFHPSMISAWVTDSFERKEMERDLLTKLLINLTKPQDGIISQDQLIKGFESVLVALEDAVNDAPKAAEYLGRLFAKAILENIVALSKIGQLICEGGEEQGRLVETGLAAEVLGSVLDIIKSEKGDSVLNEIRASSKMRLDKFRPVGSNKSSRIDKFV